MPGVRLFPAGGRPKPRFSPLSLLERPGVHELCEEGFGDLAALTGFALARAPAREGAALWITQSEVGLNHGEVSCRGAAGVAERAPPLVFVRTGRAADVLWAVEEAARSRAAAVVVAEVEEADFTATRRLALACARHGSSVMLLMPYNREGATAASTRWRLSSLPSAPNAFDVNAPGNTRWKLTLERSREWPELSGSIFTMEVEDATLSLRAVPGLVDDPLFAGAEPDRPFRRSA